MIPEDFNGIISLGGPGGEIETLCRGYADIPNRRPIGPATRFGMASGSKAFTAAAVLRLVEDGSLSLDSRADDIVAGCSFGDGVAVRLLLEHRSGIADYFDESTEDDYSALWRERPNYSMQGPSDFLPLFAGKKPAFEPGARFAYSNAGYVLLACIIERITRRSFPDYVREAVFGRCRMESAGYDRLDAPRPDSAVGYVGEGEGRRSNVYSIPVAGGGDGGCFASAEDMRRFWQALGGGELLAPETVSDMLSIHSAETGEGDRYGLGVWLAEGDDDLAFVQGFDPGVRFLSYYRRSSGRVLTVCANVEGRLRPLLQEWLPRLA